MTNYHHVLILIQDLSDGSILVDQAAALAGPLSLKVTLAHISDDYREMNYVTDSLWDDVVSEEVIKAKDMLSELADSANIPVDTRQLVTMSRLDDVEQCIKELGIDLVMLGHRNRFMGSIMSRSAEFINHLSIDILIKHIHQ